jgi:predicted nucleic acid-binding protein
LSCERRRFALDASVVITFSKNGQFDLLEQVLATRACVTDEVYRECGSARISLDAGIALGRILSFTNTAPDDLAFFARVRRQMDAGEASAVTAARALSGCVVSDDGEAIAIGGALLGPGNVVGTREVLCFAVEHGHLTAAQAEVHLATFITGGAYVPAADPGFFEGCAGS